MPTLLQNCKRYFGSLDLYTVLGVRRTAGEAEIRRGYHKISLQVHPDRVSDEEKEEANLKFQILGKVYSVLSDKEQKAVYDEQGIVDEESDAISQDRNWEEYWRLLFKKITVEDIQAYEEKYRGSEEERADIIQAYLDFEGDMDNLMDSVIFADIDNEPRIREIIQKAIKKKEVPAHNAFVKESKKKQEQRRKRANEEAQEAEEMKKEMGLGDQEDDLKALIHKKQKSREKELDGFMAQLEAKYCNKGGKKATGTKKGKK
ncbi:PREDICTED: dnaJ homolog subfamily C member 9 [Nanorana parkeri]|uniref:dnaJ homolog subfamily C member 9 n=1 Tax=Nanorana parkeri TaxID=125878 RepID=UPI000854A43B|nr:PREDICTED: dnaJ homolog subfamily C member 9 [Nanorana parkeri]